MVIVEYTKCIKCAAFCLGPTCEYFQAQLSYVLIQDSYFVFLGSIVLLQHFKTLITVLQFLSGRSAFILLLMLSLSFALGVKVKVLSAHFMRTSMSFYTIFQISNKQCLRIQKPIRRPLYRYHIQNHPKSPYIIFLFKIHRIL